MKTLSSIEQFKNLRRQWFERHNTVAFVPTMGNLHEGHLQLVRVAQQKAERVVVSIFVNPLQFAPGSDYQSYPRTLEEDSHQLQALGVDALFAPPAEEMYPQSQTDESMTEVTKVMVPHLSELLCGEYRPGHFQGVTTIVAKLFNIIQAQVAVFGEKDYQQLTIIRQMVKDLCFPVQIVGVETMRESSGLAMSSRNQYLSDTEKQQAASLYQCLLEIKSKVKAGETDYKSFEQAAVKELDEAGFKTEYCQICDAHDLSPADPDTPSMRVLAAAWLGKARLIDNIEI